MLNFMRLLRLVYQGLKIQVPIHFFRVVSQGLWIEVLAHLGREKYRSEQLFYGPSDSLRQGRWPIVVVIFGA